jgi:hypothetical protein
MKPVTWSPEDKDEKVNQYLDHINRAPYPTIAAVSIGLFCLFTVLILLSSF